MVILEIHGENSAASLYLWELTIQCGIAKHAYDNLRERSQIQLKRGRLNGVQRLPPGHLFADCAAFMSAAAVISRILFSGARASDERLRDDRRLRIAARRSAALRELLALRQLPTLQSLRVRNAFEHIDERLDQEMRDRPSGHFVSINTTGGHTAGARTLKRFDPRDLSISYLTDNLSLTDCMEEITCVRESLDSAYPRARKDKALLSCTSIGEGDG
jgi:hypothetical protein